VYAFTAGETRYIDKRDWESTFKDDGLLRLEE